MGNDIRNGYNLITPDISLDIIEDKMLSIKQMDCPVIHRFSPGLYIRELHMFAGTFAIGHYQRYDHFNLFLKGKILTKGGNGENIELSAPMSFTSKPGRKFGYILEDVVWLNIYPTDETDVETLENTYLDKSNKWTEHNSKTKGSRKNIENILDYKKILTELKMTDKDVRKQTENKEDQIPMPYGDYKFLISKSPIEGKGVFASANMVPGEIIGPSRIGDKRTPLGRYTNHALDPNAEMICNNGNIYLVATKNIEGCKGGFNGDEITTDYRKNLKLIGVRKCQE